MTDNISNIKPEVVSNHRCLLGEGPVWHELESAVWWVDVLKGEIHKFSMVDQKEKVLSVGQMVGSVALCANGDFIAGLENGIHFINRETGEMNHITSPEKHLPDNRSNDGKCDPSGRFWIGTMSKSEEANAGSLYMVTQDGSVTKKISNTTISNGMAWSPDKKTFYFIDSPTRGVDAYDYDGVTGEISNKQTVIKLTESDGYPDGMTIDSEGMLWIAQWDGWQVSRWNPANGEKMLSVKLPVARPTCCTFGGEGLGDLFISTASTGLSEEELKQQPEAGMLFVVRNIGYTGLPANKFEV
ncbi:MAG: SMP-30/gluconolactonase/LRE family protein [Chitinophagaceae bacterium]|nr:SMP-30/gluconolactonase/LRE family protein [Chitinophagaceae bacterium]